MALKLLIIVLRNLRRQPRRTILTALSFAIAVFIYTVLVAVPASMDQIAADAAKGLRLVVTAHNAYLLPARYCNPIRKMLHVVGCSAQIAFTAIYQDPRDVFVTFGATPDIVSVTGGGYEVPAEQTKEVLANRRGATIGAVLMREHHWQLGKELTIRNPSDAKMALTVIPMVELPDTVFTSRMFFFNRKLLDDAVKNLYGEDIQDRATYIAVKVDRADNLGLVMNEIDENFHNSDAETETVTEVDSLANVVSGIGDVRAIIYSLSIVVLLTVLMIAANSMAMMVRDRVGEVAVMRALGFTGAHIAALLMGEAALIGLSGAVIGALAALRLFGGGISLGAVTGPLGYMAVRPPTAIAAVAAAFAVTLLSAALPIAGAIRIAPAMGFRKIV